jgi:hypothetical protein
LVYIQLPQENKKIIIDGSLFVFTQKIIYSISVTSFQTRQENQWNKTTQHSFTLTSTSMKLKHICSKDRSNCGMV